MKIVIKRLGDNTGKKQLLLQIGYMLLAYQWLRRHAAQVASILLGLALLPLAIRLGRFGGWLGVAIAFYVFWVAVELMRRPVRVEHHTGNTQPLKPL